MSLVASVPAPVVLGLVFCDGVLVVLWLLSVELAEPRLDSWLELSPPDTPAVEPRAP